jgi:uncharacterized Zn finger protein
MSWWYGQEYESKEQKRRKALLRIKDLRKKNGDIRPVCVEGRTLAKSFWGKAWCKHLDLMADHDNRLPRGRSYVRNGSVCHLDIRRGEVEAFISGTQLYTVTMRFAPLPGRHWERIKKACKGKIANLLDLLQGKLSREVMALVSDPQTGLFPGTDEITFSCSCPDWAKLCKHIAAVFYGIGCRLDEEPELLFLMRGVDPKELFTLDMLEAAVPEEKDPLRGTDLGELFGIDLSAEISDSTLFVPPGKEAAPDPPSPAPAPKTPAAPPDSGKERKGAKPQDGGTPSGLPPLDFQRLTGGDIAAFRKAAGLTVYSFSSRLGMSQATVQRWENEPGILRLHYRSLNKIKELYKKIHRRQGARN